jgi:hypothetical protein
MSRFWKNVDKTDGCWNWTGTLTEKGYGRFKTSTKNWRAHRLSYEMHCGAVPDGMQVLHECDNPSCVRPDHLFLGTNADNMADKCAKGRESHYSPKGEQSGRAKLTEAQVLDIRGASGTAAEIARQFGMSRTAVRDIRAARTWAHI